MLLFFGFHFIIIIILYMTCALVYDMLGGVTPKLA